MNPNNGGLFGLRGYLFDPPDLPVDEPDLDAVGMVGGPGEDILHLSPGEPAGPLVSLQDDVDLGAYPDVAPDSPVGFHGPAM